jgi:hypothetical protein
LDDLGLFPDIRDPVDVDAPDPEPERVLFGVHSCDDGHVAGGTAPDQPERDRVLAGLRTVVPDHNAAGHGVPPNESAE